VRAVLTASDAKLVVAMETVGVPSFSMPQESWIHHDVQLPQSEEAAITTSALRAMNSRFCGVLP
jgi:hypothetical protein